MFSRNHIIRSAKLGLYTFLGCLVLSFDEEIKAVITPFGYLALCCLIGLAWGRVWGRIWRIQDGLER